MVDIGTRFTNYAFIAPPGVNRSAKTLQDLGVENVERFKPSLTKQSTEVQNSAAKINELLQPQSALEVSRGLQRSSELTAQIERAGKDAATRLAAAAARANIKSSQAAFSGSTSIASIFANRKDNSIFSAVAASLNRQATEARTKAESLTLKNGANQVATKDPFDRTVRTIFAASGQASLDVQKRALVAGTTDVAAEPGKKDGFVYEALTFEDGGRPSGDNQGFTLTIKTGAKAATIVVDTRDPAEDDFRASRVEITTGGESDVVFVAGDNSSIIRTGGGNDLVFADGESIVYGGDGNDVITAKTAVGEAGNDVLFSNGFAAGGVGNDTITLFGLGEDEPAPTGSGGDGDDVITANVFAQIDGGDGKDVLVLRDGGIAIGGAGDDTITAIGKATVDGGAGNDDIVLTDEATANGGDGDDGIAASAFATVAGGKGDDFISLSKGGNVTYAKGDGRDSIQLYGAAGPDGAVVATRLNEITLDGIDYSEVNVDVFGESIQITFVDPAETGRLIVNRYDIPSFEEDVLLRFNKDGQTQVVTVNRADKLVGQKVPLIA